MLQTEQTDDGHAMICIVQNMCMHMFGTTLYTAVPHASASTDRIATMQLIRYDKQSTHTGMVVWLAATMHVLSAQLPTCSTLPFSISAWMICSSDAS